MYKVVSHVIFDMDGLLLNTEDLYSIAYQNICTPFGKTYDWSIKIPIMGKKPDVASKYVIDKLNLPLTPEEWKSQLAEQLSTVFAKSVLMPGAKRLVEHLKKHGIPIAISSGSSREAYEAKTNHHRHFFMNFNPIVLCGTDPEVKHGKPHSDAYDVTRSRFSPIPEAEKCLVFEDAPNGVLSGISAGMQVVMVPDEHIPHEMTTNSTLVLNSLNEFKPELFGLPAFD